jgi:TPR repeat protein
MCFLGQGGRIDKAEARRLYKLASDAGDANAQHNLAVLLFQGIDGPANMQEVRRLLKRAAKQGHVDARRRLADLDTMEVVDEPLDSCGADPSPLVDMPAETVSCVGGVATETPIDSGLCADLMEGHRLYMEAQRVATCAIKSGDNATRDEIMRFLCHNPLRHEEPRLILDAAVARGIDANSLLTHMQVDVAYLHNNGIGVPVDLAEARRLYRLAATRGNSIAQSNLSQMLYDGRGGPKDVPEAMRIGKARAEHGSVDEQNLYAGLLTRSGRHEEAHHWFGLAADAGCGDAQMAVAANMHYGVGCPVDLKGARRMYDLAASNGYSDDALLSDCRSALADDMCKLLLEEEAESVSPPKPSKQSKRRKNKKTRLSTSTLCSVDEGTPVVLGEPVVADAVDTDPITAVFVPPTMESLALDENVVSGPAESTLGGETTCIVCFTNPKTHLATPCFHQCVCDECAAKLDKCPVCRSVVRDWGCVRIA